MQSLQLRDLSNNKVRNSSSTKALIALPVILTAGKTKPLYLIFYFKVWRFEYVTRKKIQTDVLEDLLCFALHSVIFFRTP